VAVVLLWNIIVMIYFNYLGTIIFHNNTTVAIFVIIVNLKDLNSKKKSLGGWVILQISLSLIPKQVQNPYLWRFIGEWQRFRQLCDTIGIASQYQYCHTHSHRRSVLEWRNRCSFKTFEGQFWCIIVRSPVEAAECDHFGQD